MAVEPKFVDVDEAIRLYEAGETLEQIGSKLGVSGGTVRRRMEAAGHKRRSPGGESVAAYWRDNTPDLEPFFRRYEAGEGSVRLAREAGIGQRRFLTLLRESGVTPRTMGEELGMRFTRMSVSERAAQTSAANAAMRGKPASPGRLAQRARTMEATLQLAGRGDLIVAVWLAQRGVVFTPQKAEGPFNIDIAVHEPRVAVEVDGFHHSPGLRTLARSRTTPAERRDYLFDRGWRLIEISSAIGNRLAPACADHVVSLLEEARSNEPAWGQYCVIGGNGELPSGGERETQSGP